MKGVKSWKVMSFVLVIGVFLSLYGFIYYESVKQPSEGWSGSIPIQSYEADLDFKNPDRRTSLALASGDQLVIITTKDKGVSFETFSSTGEKLRSTNVEIEYPITEINGVADANKIYLSTVSQNMKNLKFLELDIETFEVVREKSYITEAESYNLQEKNVVAYYGGIAEVYDIDTVHKYEFDQSNPVQMASSIIIDDVEYVAAIVNNTGTNELVIQNKVSNNNELKLIDTFSGSGTIQPSHFQLTNENGRLKAFITMTDSKTNSISLNIYTFNESFEQAEMESFDLFTYNGIPHYDGLSGRYIIGIFDNNLGRTEVARGKSVYPNYYLTKDFDSNGYKQLTNTEGIGRNPSLIRIDGYEYLIHNEHTEGNSVVMMTSTNPEVIKKSMSMGKEGLFEIFLRTIVNYPAILFSGILPTVSILLPVLFIGLPFLMLKLSWVEQNKNKTMLLILGMYTVSKLYVYSKDIFDAFESAKILPGYLASASGHWSVLAGISVLTIAISLRRNYEVRHKNESFMKSLAIYMLLDVTVLNLFFLPYTLI